MPKLRDRSKIRQLSPYAISQKTCYTIWTESEKKTMVKALKQGADINEIFKKFPNRTDAEVRSFICNRKRMARECIQEESEDDDTPDNNNNDVTWVELIDKLLANIPDYSYAFQEIFCYFQAELEKPKTPPRRKSINISNEANWNLIYEYIATLFSGAELPHLGQLEAGIVLMQIEDLLEYYDRMNAAEQLHLVNVKHKLLLSMLTAEKNNLAPEEKQRIVDTMLNLSIMRTSQDLPPSSGQPPTTGPILPALTTPKDEDSQSTVTSEVVVVQNKNSKMDEPLYSINPLSIPISLLNPRPK